MTKNKNKENYDITIVGGGLTGKLMATILVNSDIIPKKNLCWINTDNKSSIDKRVSFLNYNNFIKLKKSCGCDFLKKHHIKISKIEIHNMNEKNPISLEDKNSHGVIIRNDILKENLNFPEKNLVIHKSRVASTNCDQLHRYLVLEDGKKIKTSLVLSADGNSSLLRKLSNINYMNHTLNHTIISGYLNCKNFDMFSAKQIFLKDSFIGLLPYSKNMINFVWSLDSGILNKNSNFKHYNELIKRLNYFFSKENISFISPKSKNIKLQIYPINIKYVQKPFQKRIALIGDAAHTIHPLAGQGFNLSIEDCFDVLKCLQNAKKLGKDFGEVSVLKEYNYLRKYRIKFITLVTTSLFYIFKNQKNYLNKLINFSFEKIDKTSFKNIFKILARGY